VISVGFDFSYTYFPFIVICYGLQCPKVDHFSLLTRLLGLLPAFTFSFGKFWPALQKKFKSPDLFNRGLREYHGLKKNLRDTNYTNCREFQKAWVTSCEFVNGAEGISDIEGKAATGNGERAGKRASFKFVSRPFWNFRRRLAPDRAEALAKAGVQDDLL